MRDFIINQLEYDPTNSDKKRVAAVTGAEFILSYKTWRVYFILETKIAIIQRVSSGYTEAEIKNQEDPYKDKSIHRNFNANFKQSK